MILFGAAFFWWKTPTFLVTPLQAVSHTVLGPFQSLGSAVGYSFRSQFLFFASLQDVKQENSHLHKENLRLLAENAAQKQAANENEELRRNVELLPKEKYEFLAATVIGRDPAGLTNTFTLDKGSNLSVSAGMPVVVESGVFIGRVSEVFPHTSVVRLITNQESVVNSETTSNAVLGVVRGEHGLSAKLDMVEQGKELKSGDGVVTSGLGGEIPRGLLMGTLSDVRLSDDKLFQQATLTSPVSIKDVRFVFLIR
jgi:rod shape-determining protein MreC